MATKSAMPYNNDTSLRACAKECRECETVCAETMVSCLGTGGKHAAPEHVLLLSNCARMCRTCDGFMVAGLGAHTDVCGACAAVCEACAKDCEALGPDEQMKTCIEMCRRCAESCRKIARREA